MVLAHVVEDYQPVLGFLWLHLLEINVFDRKEHLGPDLAGGVSLANDRPIDSGGSRSASEDPSTTDPQFYGLDLFVEIENVNQHLEIIHLCD